MPFAEGQFPDGDFYLLQDNSPIHNASAVRDFLDSALPDRVLPHPPYSPDLNPVEQIGNLIKKRYFEIQNVPNPEIAIESPSIEQIWTTINRIAYQIHEDTAYLSTLASSMHSRLAAVIAANGSYTRY